MKICNVPKAAWESEITGYVYCDSHKREIAEDIKKYDKIYSGKIIKAKFKKVRNNV